MYTLYTSLVVALLVTVLPLPFVSIVWTLLPGLIAGVAAFVWISRRVSKRIEAVVQASDAELAPVQRAAATGAQVAPAQLLEAFTRAVAVLQRGFFFEKWQIGAGTMLNGRAGMLLFTRWTMAQMMPGGTPPGALAECIPYLERARPTGRHAQLLSAMWPAWAMLAVCYAKGKRDLDRAVAVLEDAVKYAKKQGLLWGVYAYILATNEREAAAIDVLARGKEAAPDDKVLAENLTLLQNQKKMNMKDYGEQWFQFGLERPKTPMMQQPQMGHPRARGGMRRR